MFQQRLEKHNRLRDSKLAKQGSESGLLEKLKINKNKPKVDNEPHSAHGRAVNYPTVSRSS